MTLEIGWAFAEVQILKKWDYCKMKFIIGRGCAERQILKKWKWPYLLNWVEYFDRLLRKHWYYQDLAQEMVIWHFSFVEALPSSKFLKSDNGAISWTEWNIVMKFCIHIDIDKMYRMRLSNDTWNWLRFCRGSNSEKSETIAKWHLSLVEVLPSSKFWKSDNGAISWTECNIVMKLCIHIDIDKMYRMRLSNDTWDWLRFCRGSNSEKSETIAKWYLSSVEVLPRSKYWKSENGPISWTDWNIVMKFCIYIGILTRYSPWDCQMTFGIGRGFAEVQILKKVKINS